MRLLDFSWCFLHSVDQRCQSKAVKLRKDTALVAIVCLLLGTLIGYLLGVQVSWKQNNSPAQASGATVPPAPPVSELPEGHPPISTAADLETLKRAVESAPKNLPMLTDLANKYYDAGRYSEAITYYNQALTLDPNNISVLTDVGTAHFYSGRPDEAISLYNRSLQINPRHVQSLHNLVVVNLQGKKDVAAARAALERLKSADPTNASLAKLNAMINQPGSGEPSPSGSSNPRQRIF